MASLMWLLLPEDVAYPTVLGILLISSIAGAIAHIPAGLGVLETIFLALLQEVPKGGVIAALIAYRALYYLLPLSLALVTYLLKEKRAKASRESTTEAHTEPREQQEPAQCGRRIVERGGARPRSSTDELVVPPGKAPSHPERVLLRQPTPAPLCRSTRLGCE